MRPQQLEGPLWWRYDCPWDRFTRGLYKRHYRAAGYRKFMKKMTVRLMRRLGRQRLDDAPKKVPYCGSEW